MGCGVYAIINTVNGKMYIGSSFEIEDRWYGKQGHFTHLRKGDHDNKHFQRAFNKYGEKAFVPEILELTSKNKKKRFKREQYYIDLIGMDNLYNKSSRAGGGSGPHSEETIEKMSGKNSRMFGKHLLEETKEKIREISRKPEARKRASEKALDPDIREKNRIAHLGNQNAKGSRHYLTEQTKERMRGNQNAKGKIPWNKGLTKLIDERVAKNGEAISEAKRRKHELLSSTPA